MRLQRRAVFLLGILLCVSCLGCLVRSVHPWLKKESFVFEDNLVGGWVGSGERGTVAMTFVRAKERSYIVQYSDEENWGVFMAELAKVGTDYYLDFRPPQNASGMQEYLLFPTHSVARLEIGRDALVVHELDYGAVKAAAKLDRLPRDLRYGWDENDELILVSDTDELQRFLVGLGRDSSLFASPIRLTRKK